MKSAPVNLPSAHPEVVESHPGLDVRPGHRGGDRTVTVNVEVVDYRPNGTDPPLRIPCIAFIEDRAHSIWIKEPVLKALLEVAARDPKRRERLLRVLTYQRLEGM